MKLRIPYYLPTVLVTDPNVLNYPYLLLLCFFFNFLECSSPQLSESTTLSAVNFFCISSFRCNLSFKLALLQSFMSFWIVNRLLPSPFKLCNPFTSILTSSNLESYGVLLHQISFLHSVIQEFRKSQVRTGIIYSKVNVLILFLLTQS